jgi:hypothetical protein
MAYDSDEGHFHLTREGWKRVDDDPFPEGSIKTWAYSMAQASGWSREFRSFKCVWADPDVSRSERDRLRQELGWPYKLEPSRDVNFGEPL